MAENTVPENFEVSFVTPDPAAPAGLAPRAERTGERFLGLSDEELAAQGVRAVRDTYTVQMSDPANEPNISKHANQAVPL